MFRAVMLLLLSIFPVALVGQVASFNYASQTGTLGSTYSWIDCSSGTTVVTGDDERASIAWPFVFAFYDNIYSTSDNLSVATNGFIRLDGLASTSYTEASAFDLSSTSTQLGQIIALAVYDGKVGDNGGWVRALVTGSSPNRVFTIEYNNLEIDYNDNRYTDVQVSLYETSYKIVLKLGTDNIYKSGVDMGIHSGVDSYYDKWQEVYSGTNNTWIEYTPTQPPDPPAPPAASWNYDYTTGSLGTTYTWIDCSSGNNIVVGDDEQAQINWPFAFSYYDNDYDTDQSLSVCSNGFIRLDGTASTDYNTATAYDLTSTATNLGQIIAMAVYDGSVGDNGGYVRSLVTGSSPERIFTIEYNNLEIDYNDNRYADAQVSFYESSNKIVLKFGTENINKNGADMGLHSGVNTYFNKWQEVRSGTQNTWIEYLPPYIEVNATAGSIQANYFSLKSAFDKINDGTHRGSITIKINHSTTESASAVLNASGSGSANYSSVYIYPTDTSLSISGDLSEPLIDLNGADNVTIDGRLNATGTEKDLLIVNASTASVSGTSTLRFRNDASSNTIQYCTIKGSEERSSSGIIFFSTTSSNTGNDNNTIINNDISCAQADNRPFNAIYSSGTTGKENNGNTIQDNNIYDFIRHASASYGIHLASNNTEWTITGNSFYETTSFNPTGTVTYMPVRIDGTSGNGFVVSGNYIGGSEPLCAGSAWTKNNTTNNYFAGIYLNVGTTNPSSVQNNTIKNFNWSNSANAEWSGIKVNNGSVNIGTASGNTIGASTGTGSIQITGGTNGQPIYGIRILGSGVVNCSNNIVGSITGLATNSNHAAHIYGIYISGTPTTEVLGNSIGSTTTSSSINSSSGSSSNAQRVQGIYSTADATTVISHNTIANLTNSTTNTGTGTSGYISGIRVTNGANTISGNTIRDLSIANANSSSSTPSAVGIFLDTYAEVQSVENNVVYDISNTYSSFTGCVVGLYGRNSAGAAAGSVNANFVHSISATGASAGAELYGIYVNSDALTYSNNIISIGGNASSELFGIYDLGVTDKGVEFFFNTIYISGTHTGSENSYCIRYNTTNNTRDSRNNILYNARSGGSGGHYAIYYDATGGTFTGDYNDYYVSGTAGVLCYYGGDHNTLASLQTATSQDANSLNTDPQFATAGGTTAEDYVAAAPLPGIAISGITTDYDGIIRNDPPKMGALEVSPTFTWQGNTSSDFGTASNWTDGSVPPNGANIEFASSPANDCYLDQNRSLNDITNTSSRKLVLNARELTILGDILSSTANQIDATATSSLVIFQGHAAQSIPDGAFVSNTLDGLILNSSHGLNQNGDLIISSSFTLTNGDYTIGSNTLTINGTVNVASGALIGGSSTNIVIGGNGASTTLPGLTANSFTLNRANGVTLGGPVSIENALALTSGTLILNDSLTISGNSLTRTSGKIDASDASARLKFSNSSGITFPSSLFDGTINNLSIDGAGITAADNMTVTGILNLMGANPSSTKGLFDIVSDTLTMDSLATTVGIGDVTGIVMREHTFIVGTQYTFGSEFTNFTFVDNTTKPEWICVEIIIGSVPSWTPWSPLPNGIIKRLYKVSGSENATTAQASINMRYLLTELDPVYNDESKLVFWHKYSLFGGGAPHEHGKAVQDFLNHSIGVVGMPYGAVTTDDLDDSQVTIAYSLKVKNTWQGDVAGFETEWEQPQNWSSGSVPDSTDDVLIPGGLDYYPSLTASSNALANSIEMESGASITANSYDIKVSGAGGAWINYGTLYPGTGKVLFDHGVVGEIVTVSGITNFYDIEVAPNTTMQPVPGNVLRIAGAGIADATSVVDFSTINNTVEWNGGNQTIVNPNGISDNSGYFKLILSGSGTKTMPTTDMSISDELKLDGTVSVTAQSSLTIGGEFEILDNASFSTGNNDHTVGGDLDNRGTFTASSGTVITLNGSSVQDIYGGAPTAFEELVIDNPAGVDIITPISISDTLVLSNGNLNIGATNLYINGAITKTSGYLNTSPQSSMTFGGTSALTLDSNIFYAEPIIDTLSVSRTGGLAINRDITVNGQLNLLSANPNDTTGCLDMGNDTLHYGATATTIGQGDLTGFVKRTTILPNIEYTFGNEFTSVTFPNIGTIPSEIRVKTSIGKAPTWKTDAVKRIYELAHTGGDGTRAVIKGHYKDSELNGNVEQDLIDITYIIPYSTLIERGRSDINTIDNWISLNNADFGNLASTFGFMELGFSESTTDIIKWDGSVDSDWTEPTNWTPAYAPDSSKLVIIPDSATTPNDPILPDSTTISTITIQEDGLLTAISGSVVVLKGAGGAWSNYGTYEPSTSRVVFDHGDNSNISTISGETNFYDIEAGENTTLQPVAGNILRIAGTGIADSTSIVDFSTEGNTVEWNGTNQTIVNPVGLNGMIMGFHNLIFSNSGTKTLPDTTFLISGDFTMTGSATTSAVDSIIVSGNVSIGSGNTLALGSHVLIVGGNFENNGTFTSSTGSWVLFNGDSSQSISGNSSTSFHQACMMNDSSIYLGRDITIIDSLALCAGPFHVDTNTLTINGGISNTSGNMVLTSSSSLVFGGTTALSLNNNLFNGNPTLDNLTIDRSGGVAFGNEGMTVNGTLTLTSGTLTIGSNTLDLANNMAVRTSGNIDASDTAATIAFGNTTAASFPASLFTGSVNNLNIYGTGGITTVEDITVNGVLTLAGPNPSSTKGILDMDNDTLDMGPNSTTLGHGDVSGIIRRTSIQPEIIYTMGSEFSSIYFPDVGTLPTEISLKVTLGTAPSWQTGAVLRVYDLIQTGGSGTQAIIQSHYLDSELNGNDETKLVEWLHYYSPPLTIEYGRSAYNTVDNWVAVSNANVGVFPSAFGGAEISMDEYQITDLTWVGATSSSWITATNWSPTGAPSDETVVTIPDSSTTAHDPLIPVFALCSKIIIEPGGYISSVPDGRLTLMGSDSAWVNNGSFEAENGSIIFANGDENDTVIILGNNSFYNLEVSEKTFIQPGINSVTKIAGQLDADPYNCILDFSTNPNSVEYNGDKIQYIVSPRDGYAYDQLSFTGSGTKVLAADTLKVLGDLTIDTTLSTVGNTIWMAGTAAQNLAGSTGDTLDYLIIDNAAGVTLTNTGTTEISGRLSINTGTQFMMPASSKLSVSGTIDNNAGTTGLYLQSDATGTASLIHNNDNVDASVERYISGPAEAWHFLSSPVSNQEISGSWLPTGTYGNGTGYDLYVWHEASSCWIYKLNTTSPINWNTVHPGSDFVVGQGYLYSVQAANPTKSYAGDLNNGPVTYGLTVIGTDPLVQGFNLVGNPYPSSIDWRAASGWTHNNLVQSGGGYNMWIWNPTADNYGVYNSADPDGMGTNSVTRYIAPMQGFFVEAENAGNLGMTNAVRVHDGAGNWFKGQQQSINDLSLTVTSNAGYGADEILLEFNHYQKEKGAKKLFSHVQTAPALYMKSFGEDLSVGHFTTPDDTPMVPVSFSAGIDGKYTLNCQFDMSSFELVWLEDKKEDFFLDLKQSPEYWFNAETSDDADRFVLYFGPIDSYVNEELPARIFYDGSSILVDLSLVDNDAGAQVIDLSGRVLFKQDLKGKMINKIHMPDNTQIVLVYVSTSEASICRKVLLNRF